MGPVSKVLGALNLISRVNFAAIERGLSSGLMPVPWRRPSILNFVDSLRARSPPEGSSRNVGHKGRARIQPEQDTRLCSRP